MEKANIFVQVIWQDNPTSKFKIFIFQWSIITDKTNKKSQKKIITFISNRLQEFLQQ